MHSRGVLVHCPCRLGAAVSVLAAEVPCGHGVFTKWALEHLNVEKPFIILMM
jgi:hypothetical protein